MYSLLFSTQYKYIMLSSRTNTELVHIIDELNHGDIDRIFEIFGLSIYLIPAEQSLSKAKKGNYILRELGLTNKKGPFSESFQLDLAQYVIEISYRNIKKLKKHFDLRQLADEFAYENSLLINALKKDGYTIKDGGLKKLLPEEIEEAKTESELVQLLTKFNLSTAKGHLEQAIDNYVSGNWAGANSQFRPFIESLLIEISNVLLPAHNCNSAAGAIKLLHKTSNPPFFSEDLNEVESSRCDKPFIEGFWKRLHPAGAHPGLSDEADCAFRYHITIVVAHYLLKRFEERKKGR